MAKYNSILETVGRTPAVRITKLAPEGVNLYVKIEAFNPMGSVKDRLALGVIEDAEASGALAPGQTVIEATSGNTGIGLAMVCAKKGYPLVVTMAESFSIERRKMMRFLGAKVVLTPASEKGTGMVTKAEELAKKNGWFLCRQFENEANANMHSKTTAVEILEDFADEGLDYWVTGFGTGGTLKGVARVLAEKSPNTKIIVCEPDNVPILRQRHPAASGGRWLTLWEPPELSSARDAGLVARLHPQAHRRCRLDGLDRPDRADQRGGCDAIVTGAGAEGRNLCRYLKRCDVLGRVEDLRVSAERLDGAVHAT